MDIISEKGVGGKPMSNVLLLVYLLIKLVNTINNDIFIDLVCLTLYKIFLVLVQ